MFCCVNEHCKAYETGFENQVLHETIVYWNTYLQKYEPIWNEDVPQQQHSSTLLSLDHLLFQPIFVKLSCPFCSIQLIPCHHCNTLFEMPTTNSSLPIYQHCENCGYMNLFQTDLLPFQTKECGVISYEKVRQIQRLISKKESQYIQYKKEQMEFWTQKMQQEGNSSHQKQVLQFLIQLMQIQMEQFEQSLIQQQDLEQTQRNYLKQHYWKRFNTSHIPLLESLYKNTTTEKLFSMEILCQFFSQFETLFQQTHSTIESAANAFQQWIIHHVEENHMICLQNALWSAKEQKQMRWTRETTEYLQLLQQINLELQQLVKQVIPLRRNNKQPVKNTSHVLPRIGFEKVTKSGTTNASKDSSTNTPKNDYKEEELLRKIELLLSCYETIACCIIQK